MKYIFNNYSSESIAYDTEGRMGYLFCYGCAGVIRQQDLYLHLHLLKVYIFTAHFEIRKLIFVGYVIYTLIVTLAARSSSWHKIYFNFELNLSLFVMIKSKLHGGLKI